MASERETSTTKHAVPKDVVTAILQEVLRQNDAFVKQDPAIAAALRTVTSFMYGARITMRRITAGDAPASA